MTKHVSTNLLDNPRRYTTVYIVKNVMKYLKNNQFAFV